MGVTRVVCGGSKPSLLKNGENIESEEAYESET
jgi:hypothetical protein